MPNDVRILFTQPALMTHFSLTATRSQSLSTSSKGRSSKSGNMPVCIAMVALVASLAFMICATLQLSID